jgi:hypothetical protein
MTLAEPLSKRRFLQVLNKKTKNSVEECASVWLHFRQKRLDVCEVVRSSNIENYHLHIPRVENPKAQ